MSTATVVEQIMLAWNRHCKRTRVGLGIGVEFVPESGGARRFCEQLMAKGLLCKETHDNIIRFAPPLIITKDEIDWAMEKIEQVLSG